MTDPAVTKIWKQILEAFEDKLQYSFLEQARAVVDIKIEGDELTLLVTTDEAERFFNGEVNRQRLIILSRPFFPLEKVVAKRVDAEPLR